MEEREDLIRESMSSPEVKEWIASYAQKTQSNYRIEFPHFLVWLYFEEENMISPKEMIRERTRQWLSDNPQERGSWERIVNRYKQYLEEKGFKENTIMSYRRVVMSFFSYNRVPLKFRRKESKIRSKKTVKIKFAPTNSMMRAMYSHADSLGRALLLVAYHSSLSGVDIKDLRIENLPDLYGEDGRVDASRHYYLTKSRSKSGEWQQTFLSTDALQSLDIHLRERGYPREGYLLVGKRSESEYSSGQLMPRSMNQIVKNLARSCLSDADSKRFKFKSIRDAFHDAANRALSVRGENRMVNRLMGQSSGNNAGDKYAISEETMREAYEAIFALITINDRRREHEEYESLNTRLLNQEELIKALTDRNRGQEKDIKALQSQNARMTVSHEIVQEEIRKMRELIRLRDEEPPEPS
ncbi:MAG: hypothetical protein NWE89_07045 [Candidatus Bathyarchaeota archaeon]|nr:hypothetical protein [Candidatus Bathyarchaeota archaeon]